MTVLDLMSGFIVELRKAGLPVSLTENLDAMEAVKEIPLRIARRLNMHWPRLL